MEAHDASNADYDQQSVLIVDEDAEFEWLWKLHKSTMNLVYDFDRWTFDTCSPLVLRFSQRGSSTTNSPAAAPMWKCLVVDLLDKDLVVKEDPEECTVVFSMSNPEYRLLVLGSCVIAKKNKLTSVCLWSVYHYSEIRKRITATASGLPPALACLCESFYFCPGCWRGTSTVYNIPNAQFESEKRYECKTPCKFCAQYSSRIEGDPPQEIDFCTDEDSED